MLRPFARQDFFKFMNVAAREGGLVSAPAPTSTTCAAGATDPEWANILASEAATTIVDTRLSRDVGVLLAVEQRVERNGTMPAR